MTLNNSGIVLIIENGRICKLRDTRSAFFAFASLIRDLFDCVDSHAIIDFIKQVNSIINRDKCSVIFISFDFVLFWLYARFVQL